MTADAPGSSTPAQRYKPRDKIRRTVSKMIEDSGLHMQELPHELVITNPEDPEQGQIHVAYADGRVFWERVTWECLGPLKGSGDSTGVRVTAGKIISTLM
jgi:hypothetical protein